MSDIEPVETGGELVAEVKPMAWGRFSIYEDGKGGFVLITDMPEHGGERRQHIPHTLVKLVSGGGMLGKRFSGLFGS